jgi:uncharacterized short protein YbdD (DUF466 family)
MPGSGSAGQRASGLVGAIGQIGSFLRRIAGMPDYAAYLEHLSRCHPDRSVPSEREFYAEFVRSKYGDGCTRCC